MPWYICYAAASTPASLLYTSYTQLQACGQPPAEIVKELAPGLEFGPDGMPLLPNMGQGIPGMPRMCLPALLQHAA